MKVAHLFPFWGGVQLSRMNRVQQVTSKLNLNQNGWKVPQKGLFLTHLGRIRQKQFPVASCRQVKYRAFCSVSDLIIWSRISRSLSTMTVSPPVCCTYYAGFCLKLGVYPLVRISWVRHFDMWRKIQFREGYWIVTLNQRLRQHRLGGSGGLRRIFCPNRAVWKKGNTQSIPTFSILSLGPKSHAESPCPIMQRCPIFNLPATCHRKLFLTYAS